MKMRRWLAIAMMLCFGAPLTAPLFAADAANNLPACCRRDGRHHCAASLMGDAAQRSISTIAPRCQDWPKSTPAPAPQTFTPGEALTASTPLFAHAASAAQTQARYRVSFARSRQKRGPPAFTV
jgi:hypothetical protein